MKVGDVVHDPALLAPGTRVKRDGCELTIKSRFAGAWETRADDSRYTVVVRDTWIASYGVTILALPDDPVPVGSRWAWKDDARALRPFTITKAAGDKRYYVYDGGSGTYDWPIDRLVKSCARLPDAVPVTAPTCARAGCTRPLAYPSALYCGAGCSARAEMERKSPPPAVCPPTCTPAAPCMCAVCPARNENEVSQKQLLWDLVTSERPTLPRYAPPELTRNGAGALGCGMYRVNHGVRR